MGKIEEVIKQLGWERASKTEKVCRALTGIGIDPRKCFFDQEDNLVVPFSAIPHTTMADRKFVENVIELHDQGKDVEQILFSLDLPYEEPEDE